LSLDEEDIPLAQLQRIKHAQPVSTSSLSELESAAFSLTALQDDPSFQGSVQNFLHAPLLLSHGRHMNMIPKPGVLLASKQQPFSSFSRGFS
jgi:hypothetical protein